MRLQALVDKKKVVILEATIRDALRLDDAEGIECLPNEEIFAELARMSYEKPLTKLTFYKAFFSSHLVRNVDSPTKFYMYPHFLQVMIRKQVGDLSTHTTKYSSPALTQKVFANMRTVGKGFSGVETPLFEGIIVEQQVDEGADEGADKVHNEGVPAASVVAKGVISATNDVVPTAVEEPSIPSPTPPAPSPHPSQDQPSTSQVHLTPPHSPQAQQQSPQHQPQPLQDAGLPMDLLQNLMDTCTTLTRSVKNLEQDKIAQALEITKLKSRVKKLERRNKASKLQRLKKERMIADMDVDVDVILEDAKEVAVEKSADVYESADVQGRKAESQAQIYKINLEHANKVLSMQDDDVELAELQEIVEVVTTAKLITEVVTTPSTTITIATPQLTTAAAPTLTTAPSAARKRKGVVIRDPEESATLIGALPPFLNSKRKQKEDNDVKRYQALKRKPLTEAQARKNMMIYLRNVVGFKIDYFKGMTYDDVCPIFEKHFDSNVAFLQKTKEQVDEEDSRALKRLNESQEDKAAKKKKMDEEVEKLKRHLQIVPNDEDDVYIEATPLARKVPVVDYEIYNEHNKPYLKSKELTVHTKYTSSNLEKSKKCLWSSECQELEAVRVPWCADYHIHYNTVDFAGRTRYSLTRFTLDQMLNNVLLEVKEESEVSLELLSFGVDAAKEFKENMLSDYYCQAKLMLLINAAKSN
nr:hypothetical protein [Tanacetum cinerariifolium]